jgi:hypothetical protein
MDKLTIFKGRKAKAALEDYLSKALAECFSSLATPVSQWDIKEIKVEDESSFSFAVPTEGVPVNFETLLKVSKRFGTENITFRGASIAHGYCETCAWDEDAFRVVVKYITAGVDVEL